MSLMHMPTVWLDRTKKDSYRIFFLCLIFLSLFFRLCVAILWRLRFLPLGMVLSFL